MALDNARAGESTIPTAVESKEETSGPRWLNRRSAKGYCQNCGIHLGDFYNAWHRITGSYYVPALAGSYTSLLKNMGKPKAAALGTNLEGCTIQPVSCPALCTDAPIGFFVVDAPPDKKQFRGRDFFKLRRIELRCEPWSKSFVVEPLEETAHHLLDAGNNTSPSLTPPSTLTAISMGDVKMESFPTNPGLGHQYIRHHFPQSPAATLPSAAPYSPQLPVTRPKSTPRAEKQPSAPSTTQTTQSLPESKSHTKVPFSAPTTTSSPIVASLVSQSQLSNESHNARSQTALRSPPAVSLDAIQRLQTQVSQNSGALAAHTRDIRRREESCAVMEETLRREFNTLLTYQSGELQRVDGAVSRLHHEMLAMRQSIEDLRHDLHTMRVEAQPQRNSVVAPAQASGGSDAAMELMAQQIAITAQKTSEIDTLKITIEIMKKKIGRLEEGSRQPPAAGSIPSSTAPRAIPSAHSSALPHSVPSSQQSPQLRLYHSSSIPTTTGLSGLAQKHHNPPSQTTAWATVNPSVKRNHETNENSLSGSHAQVASSTKRPKLTSEPLQTHVSSTPQSSPNAHTSRHQFLPCPRPLPSQPPFSQSAVDMQSHSSSHVPFATQNAHPDSNWLSTSQGDFEQRSRGRIRGGVSETRGGKVRRSMPGHIQSTEWNQEDWQVATDYQNRPDFQISQTVRSTTGIARRGTGGGGGFARHGYTPTDRSGSMNETHGFRYESPGEGYENGKKTRTKPVRNAEGILIRKDGLPDMRSQSSAANLRKVNARREGEGDYSPSETPFHPYDGTTAHAATTPSPSSHGAQEAIASTHSKHTAIMDKMFPRGVEESRRDADYTRELFDRDHGHTVHTHAHAPSSHAQTSSLQVKKEPEDQPVPDEILSSGVRDANVETNGGRSGVDEAVADGPPAAELQTMDKPQPNHDESRNKPPADQPNEQETSAKDRS